MKNYVNISSEPQEIRLIRIQDKIKEIIEKEFDDWNIGIMFCDKDEQEIILGITNKVMKLLE